MGGTGGAPQGVLEFADAPYNPPVDLTAEGKVDWAHWVYTLQDGLIFEHKNRVGGPISNLTPSAIVGLAMSESDCVWSDGTMTPSTTGNLDGIYMSYPGGPGQITWTIAATTATQRLRLYIGAHGATILTAHLDDGSAPDPAPWRITSNLAPVDITFLATSTQAHLNVRWSFEGMPDADYPIMFVVAATLAAAP